MFKQLKRRLLVLNLTLITIFMIIAFSTIYLMTYNTIHNTITMDLNRFSETKKDSEQTPPKGDSILIGEIIDRNQSQTTNQPGKSISFIIKSSMSGDITHIESFFEAEDSFFDGALLTALNASDDTGHFTYEGNEWAYLKSLRGYEIQVTFLDMTSQQKVLDRLLITLIIVATVSFVVIFIISRVLTNRSIAPIKEAFDKQTLFISDASHELKTPLAVIRTNVDVLLSGATREDEKWLRYIKSEVERMGNLTNDLLYLTQVSSNSISTVPMTNFLLSDKLERLVLGMDALAYEKNITLDYDLAPNTSILGNPEQIIQVIMILLDNAFKYTPQEGYVRLNLRKSHHHVYVEVMNSGAGISADDLPHIFDRFYRSDKARSRADGSYGLGLSIAKAIVEQHKGKITCQSLPDKETNFTVRLPLVNSSVAHQ